MKVNILDAHDRFNHFRSQDFGLDGNIKQLVDSKPFGDHPYYIFVHTRPTDTTQDHRVIIQPRLQKPIPLINSMLFRVPKGKTDFQVIWIIPPVEIWPEFDVGKVGENAVILESIYMFQKRYEELARPFSDDLSSDEAQEVLFQFYPLIFTRESLDPDRQIIWDLAKEKKDALKKTAT